jgi:hypothetical protein
VFFVVIALTTGDACGRNFMTTLPESSKAPTLAVSGKFFRLFSPHFQATDLFSLE